jgi:glutathione reductase (NADPH)
MSTHYDVIVIGGGVVGGGVARPCAEKGLRVAIIESRDFGGTCPLRGCNPKKVLRGGAEPLERLEMLRGHGVHGQASIDWPELMRFKQSFVEGVPEKIEKAYARRGIDAFHGKARFTGEDSIHVQGHDLTAEHIVIGTGSSPIELGIPGEELVLSSDEYLDLPQMPASIAFIGGGFIAFEFGHISRAAGAEVSLFCRSQPLKAFDEDLVYILGQATHQRGIALHCESPVVGVEKHGDGVAIQVGGDMGERTFYADMIVHGGGRGPNTDIGLEEAGVEYSRKGVAVDEHMRTSNPRVYAAGDCAASPFALTPSAAYESEVIVANILEPGSKRVDYTGIPSVVFSLPTLAAVGLTEDEAERQGIPCEPIFQELTDSFPWKRIGETHAASKVLVHEETGVVVGAHVLGHNADEVINLFALAVRKRMTVDELDDVIWAYPTCGYELQYMIK